MRQDLSIETDASAQACRHTIDLATRRDTLESNECSYEHELCPALGRSLALSCGKVAGTVSEARAVARSCLMRLQKNGVKAIAAVPVSSLGNNKTPRQSDAVCPPTIDDRLAEHFHSSLSDKIITVFLKLRKLQEARPFDSQASDFESRRAWRLALEEHRLQQIELEIGPTLAGLRDLGFEPYGQLLGNMVVIQGTIAKIQEALELDGIDAAKLDFPLNLDTKDSHDFPRRR